MASEDVRNEGPPKLNPGVSQFVESWGLVMERYGLPRIGGRIIGLLMVTKEPMSLDDLAGRLGVSRASVSTNIRLAQMSGMVEQVTKPGDRRDYYIGIDEMWSHLMQSKLRELVQFSEMAHKAIANVPLEDTVAHDRLQEMIDFFDFFEEKMAEFNLQWHEYKTKIYPGD